MAEYQRKIDSIIDKLVDGKKEFYTKNVTEQSYIKTDMAKCINGAIFSLNNVGQKLALDELDTRIGQDETKIFDNDGNINIVELTKIANKIVNVTIENAKKKGINVTNKVEIKADNEITKIGKMIENYENLSAKEKQSLWDKFCDMSTEEKQRLEEANRRDWQKIEQEITDDTSKSIIRKKVTVSEVVEKMLHSSDPRKKEFFERLIAADNRFETWYRENIDKSSFSEINEDVMNRYVQYIHRNEEQEKEFFRIWNRQHHTEEDLIQLIPEEFMRKIENSEQPISEVYMASLLEYYNNIINTAKEYGVLDTDNKKAKESITIEIAENNGEKIFTMSPSDEFDIFGTIINKKTEERNTDIENKKEKEVNLMTELEAAQIVIPDIQRELIQYKKIISNLAQEDIEELCKLSPEERDVIFTEEFNEMGVQNVEILKTIADMTFKGDLKEILEKGDGKNFILQQLDQLIFPTKESSLTDEEFEQGILEGVLAFEEMLFEVQERAEDTIQEEEERMVDDTDEHEGTDNRDIEEQEVDTMLLETHGMEEYFSFLKTMEVDVNDLTEEANTIKAVSSAENERANDEIDK